MLGFLQHKNCQSRSKRTLLGLICRTTRTDKEIYIETADISNQKEKNLVSLCRSGIIPSEYHDYYKSLPSSSNVDDKLADTDAEEEQADSDQE